MAVEEEKCSALNPAKSSSLDTRIQYVESKPRLDTIDADFSKEAER